MAAGDTCVCVVPKLRDVFCELFDLELEDDDDDVVVVVVVVVVDIEVGM
jgi:hypothetical protein